MGGLDREARSAIEVDGVVVCSRLDGETRVTICDGVDEAAAEARSAGGSGHRQILDDDAAGRPEPVPPGGHLVGDHAEEPSQTVS